MDLANVSLNSTGQVLPAGQNCADPSLVTHSRSGQLALYLLLMQNLCHTNVYSFKCIAAKLDNQEFTEEKYGTNMMDKTPLQDLSHSQIGDISQTMTAVLLI